jgi:thioredoxin reductase
MSLPGRRQFLKMSGKAVISLVLPLPSFATAKHGFMDNNSFDVIIVGGSYSGLAAGMALGRALRTVLIIDSGLPCNRQTPHSHNFLTQDGTAPAAIATLARGQVERYDTVKFFKGLAASANRTTSGFQVQTATGEVFAARKLIFATGIRDIMPAIPGFADCWGISVLHCPYCHGFEVRGQKTALIANGDDGFEFASLLSNWTKDLTLFTNGKSTLTTDQKASLEKHQINIEEREIVELEHHAGQVNAIVLKDGTKAAIEAIYARCRFEQHCPIPLDLGCETEDNYLKVDSLQCTSEPGIFACGDNHSRMRTVANAVATGTTAGMAANKEIVAEKFR